jgi:hypothetical protein
VPDVGQIVDVVDRRRGVEGAHRVEEDTLKAEDRGLRTVD